MTHGTATAWGGTAWEALDALVDVDGTATHPHARRLRERGATRRDLADAAHALCAVHGTHPGLADDAFGRAVGGPAAPWLDEVARAFAGERQLLARVVSAAGPLPSTPGQAMTDVAYAAQRHAFQMLAKSDRPGVGVGAAAALALDWVAIRRIVAHAADLFSAPVVPLTLPPPQETATVLGALGDGAAAERALLFGARALLEQHRALWSLLEARAAARGD
ncbi:DUF6975 family protein [Sphingomonas lenta]|uniref:Uncharacterized protein n=1 Tax=Sphingomonas lenta TaxID=1141887 RepID=A0A2A2SK04_9SPHN|nr:hypothetical protein [Sphingomonas lenta]PAX09361.1 hypothetical protein CKY28_00975 [Sphingomonas lenta]